ncbi:HpcH/HpaI aldolase/citrate lyase family protein [Aestuariivirga sp.]|uniref:HpcH/HpaI aldolase/citrate lyase family protein n=1 Tax=Aestuariivirga sp. TaxID=2650926 RepID=UPI0039E2A728
MITDVPQVPLFVPASRPERFSKADGAGADAVIADLEDAVAPQDKDAARAALVNHGAFSSPLFIRVNAAGTPWFEDDLRACEKINPSALMLPKADDAEIVRSLIERFSGKVHILPLIETAKGLAGLPRVLDGGAWTAAFGSVDYALDLGCAENDRALLHARSEIVWRCRAASRPAPLDGVSTSLDDAARIESEARHAADLGFGGKLAIHPKQIAPIRAAFAPSEKEIAWAQKIIAAASQGSAQRVAGEMIDLPVLERAKKVLARQANSPRSRSSEK